MNNVYMKNFGIWLGAPVLLCHLLPFLGLYFFAILLVPIIIAGSIMGVIKTSKEIGGKISFKEAVGPVLLMIGGPFLFSWLLSIVFYGMPSMYWIVELIFVPLLSELMIGMTVLLMTGMFYAFQKAGKEGWECIVPIYNIIVMLEIAKKPTWWIAMFFIPIANIIFIIMTLNGVSKAFGKTEGFTAGLVFLGAIFWAILGYGDAQYEGAPVPQGESNDLLDN